MNEQFRRAYLALGGNIGDVAATMRRALGHLGADGRTEIKAASSLYATPPWGVTDQPEFLNASVAISTALDPLDLLAACLAAERANKRIRAARWGPRTIDLDVLWMDGVELRDGPLILPHPRITERAFVLKPLNDIAPALSVDGKTVAQWLAQSDVSGIREIAGAMQWTGGVTP